MITAEKLKTHTVKDLAAMARKKKVLGWHTMRKDELVQALLKLARADITGSAPRRRRIAVASWESLRDRVDEVRTEDAIERLESPLDGNELMEMFGRPPGPWIKPVKDHLQGEVVEGRLAKDDEEGARELAREFLEREGL